MISKKGDVMEPSKILCPYEENQQAEYFGARRGIDNVIFNLFTCECYRGGLFRVCQLYILESKKSDDIKEASLVEN